MTHLLRRPAVLLGALFLALGCVSPAAAQARKDSADKAYADALRSTVYIPDDGSDPEGHVNIGTGVLVDAKRRLVLTNYHVVLNRKRFAVSFPIVARNRVVLDRAEYDEAVGGRGGLSGKTVATSPEFDLALIQLDRLPRGAVAIPLAAEGAAAGDQVHSIANPCSVPELWLHTRRKVVRADRVRFARREAKDGILDARFIETDKPAKRGERSGPLVNERGELVGVGMPFHHADRENALYLDVSHVKEFIDRSAVPDTPPADPVAKRGTGPEPRESPARGRTEGTDKTYASALRSTVYIVVRQDDRGAGGLSSGTGVLVDVKRRLVLTSYHVVRNNDRFVVYFPIMAGNRVALDRALYTLLIQEGGGVPGKVLAKSRDHDLAVIQLDRVPKGGRALPLAPEGAARGDAVHSIGNPGSSPQMWVYTHRKVVRVRRVQMDTKYVDGTDGQPVDVRAVETDTPGKPGESGGPLVNDRGELVGITLGADADEKVGVYVDLSHVRELLDKAGMSDKPAAPPVAARGGQAPPRKAEPATSRETSSEEGNDVTALSDRLVSANGREQDQALERLKQAKGPAYTEALARSVPRLTGDFQSRAREALAERLARMRATTLKAYLQDDNSELRGAAALACAMREEKGLVPDLLKLFADPDAFVRRSARRALMSLSGEDFGPKPGGSAAEWKDAAARWRAWWQRQQDR